MRRDGRAPILPVPGSVRRIRSDVGDEERREYRSPGHIDTRLIARLSRGTDHRVSCAAWVRGQRRNSVSGGRGASLLFHIHLANAERQGVLVIIENLNLARGAVWTDRDDESAQHLAFAEGNTRPRIRARERIRRRASGQRITLWTSVHDELGALEAVAGVLQIHRVRTRGQTREGMR